VGRSVFTFFCKMGQPTQKFFTILGSYLKPDLTFHRRKQKRGGLRRKLKLLRFPVFGCRTRRPCRSLYVVQDSKTKEEPDKHDFSIAETISTIILGAEVQQRVN